MVFFERASHAKKRGRAFGGKKLPLVKCSSLEHSLQLTSDELAFANYANALANWLEPYHNYARPPPAVVLAEAAKQTELKTGHPLKGVDLTAINGSPMNGNGKKDEEPPAVTEPSVLVLNFFDGKKASTLLVVHTFSVCLEFRARFLAVSEESPYAALHIATLAQEVWLSFG